MNLEYTRLNWLCEKYLSQLLVPATKFNLIMPENIYIFIGFIMSLFSPAFIITDVYFSIQYLPNPEATQ